MIDSYNYLDWILVALLVYSTISAFVRGFIMEIISLGGLILGIYLASWNYQYPAGLLLRLTHPFLSLPPAIANFIGFLGIVFGIMVAFGQIARVIRSTAHTIGLGFPDRLLGATFGLARGCCIGVALMLALTAFMPLAPAISHSRLSPYFLAGVHAVSFVVPHDLQQQLFNGIEQIKHNVPGWIKLRG